ncbi:MAG: histidinol-phosphate transaminase [Rhodothalassiaceae bacterium]
MAELRPNPWIAALAPYVPGRAGTGSATRAVKLSANESALGASPAAMAAFRDAAGSLHLYPDGDSAALREALAAATGRAAERILCGAGSDDLLHLVGQAFAGPGDEIIHSRYGFMMYPIIAHGVGARPVAVPNRDWAADVDGILAALTERTRIVFLDNPNNPTGVYLPKAEVERLIENLPPSVVLVYDAAYAECVDAPDYTDGLDLADRHDNVLVTRTFSKLYGLAALRIGWCYGSPAVIDAMNRIRNPFNVSTPAQAAAIAALADDAHLAAARDHAIRWRRRFAQELAARDLETVPSQTNFVLVRFPSDAPRSAQAADAFLSSRGYCLRHLPGQGLGHCLRLSFGSDADNEALITAFDAFLDATA